MRQRARGHVDSNDCKITRFQRQDIGTAAERGRLRSVRMGIGTKASQEHMSEGNYSFMPRQAACRTLSSPVKNILHDVVTSEVARILREERVNRELSMNVVSERAGLSRPMISLVERKLRNPTLDTLLRIAAALEVDLVDVLQRAQKAAAKKSK